MPKIDPTTAPRASGTRYPAPFDEPCKRRSWIRLGDAAGLMPFGVHLVTLLPGAWSATTSTGSCARRSCQSCEAVMNSLRALLFLMLCGVALPGVAHEDWAYTSANVHLRAGPARDYPVVAVLPQGFELSVQGCISDYRWCDVIAGPHRGWIHAGYLVYPYGGHRVPVMTYGPQIGFVIISFVLIDYWDDYYPRYWFYRDRDYWAHRHPPPSHPGVRPPSPPRPPQDGDDGRPRPGLPSDDDRNGSRPRPPGRGDDDPRLRTPRHDDDPPRMERPERERPDDAHRESPRDEQPRDRQSRQDEPRDQRAPDPYHDRRGEQRSERGERSDSKRERHDR